MQQSQGADKRCPSALDTPIIVAMVVVLVVMIVVVLMAVVTVVVVTMVVIDLADSSCGNHGRSGDYGNSLLQNLSQCVVSSCDILPPNQSW
jgi:hypothetical protein